MKVVLELQDQPSNIKKVTVRHDIVIGRGAECNLRLSAPQVSRRHCFLRVGAGSASITDLESSNGTFINGQRITAGKRYVLTDGMAVSVGPIKFITRVETEVVPGSGQFVKVESSDQHVLTDSDAAAPPAGKQAGPTTLPPDGSPPVDSMQLAVEQAGPSAEEDEPTAGYDSDNAAKSRKPQPAIDTTVDSEAEIVDLGRRAAAQEAALGFRVDQDEDSETVADDSEVIGLNRQPVRPAGGQPADVADDEILEIVEIVDDDEVLEDVEVIEEVEVIDDVEVIDEVEVVTDDDDDIVEIVDDEPGTGTWFETDSKRSRIRSSDDDLNDFLNGLK